jgi:hypothetical protein
MDPNRFLEKTISSGIYQGRVLGFLRHNQGVVCNGMTGPKRVLVPMHLFKERPMKGQVVTYAVKILRSNTGIAARLVTTVSMGSR